MGGKRTALVTGASRRIGRSIALDLANDHAVAVHYHGSSDAAQDVVDLIEASGGEAVAVQADLSDVAQIETLVTRAADGLGAPVSVLVNNASVFEQDTLQSMTAESWTDHMTVNLHAPAILSQQMAAQLPADLTGAIINLIDQRVLKLNPQYFSYTASKTGLWTLTRTMAQALAPRIRVNGVGPGPTLANTRQSAEMFEEEAARTLLGRGPDVQEICKAVRFLLESPSITGQMMALDGGQHLLWRTADILED